jgi:uncharacterized membrane protein
MGGKQCDRRYVTVLLVAIFAYSLIFSAATIWKHNQFNSYAWDLGTFDQVLHDSVFEGRPFYYTLDLFMNPSGQYFAIHFSPILILLFPLYRLLPHPELLLVVKSAAMGAAAYPLYLLTKRLTGDTRTGVLLGLTYLLSPCIEGANWFDFQPQSLLPLLVFSTYYLLLAGRTRLYLLSTALTLAVEEHSTIIIPTVFAIYLLSGGFRGLSKKLQDRHTLFLLIATIALSAAALTASIYFKQLYPHDPAYEDIYVSTDAYSSLGFEGNAFTAPLYAVTHPADLFRALTHDSTLKIIYIALLFAPLLFAPLLSGAPAASVLLLAPFLLSNYRAYYMLGAHYPLYFMPPMYITAALFLSRRGNGGRGVATAMLVSTAVFALALSPISPASTQLNNGYLWYPQNDLTPAEVTQIHEIIDTIPADASILTQNQFFPHVSSRANAYSVPVTPFSDTQLPQIEEYLKTIMGGCDYVLLDSGDGAQLTPMAVSLAETDAGLKAAARAGNTTLYRRTP